MNTNLRHISIKHFLAKQGILPRHERVGYGMYLSPFRTEAEPSLKVDYTKNLWYDFGTGEGGSVIDLVMKLENCTLSEAIAKLENSNGFSFHSVEQKEQVRPSLLIEAIKPLQDYRLIDYLQSKRAINIEIAQAYCKQVHYFTGGKQFFAIGFQGDAGGWELRNEYFKGSTSPKSVTTIVNNSPTCLLFEGFIDMLSYLTLKNVARPNLDMVVLNSVVNLSKATDFLNRHQTLHTFLDNDEAGKRAVEQLRQTLPNSEIVDQSVFYRNHKDLNDYLCARKLENLQTIKPENKLPNNQVVKQNINPIKPKPKRGFRR